MLAEAAQPYDQGYVDSGRAVLSLPRPICCSHCLTSKCVVVSAQSPTIKDSHVLFSSCSDGEDPIPPKRRRESHECAICGNEYSKLASLQRHHKQMHEPVQCPTCHEEFLGTRALTSHRRSNHPKPLECEQCGRTYTCLRDLLHHLTTQHPVAPRQSGGAAAATTAPRTTPPPPNWRSMADPVSYISLPEAEGSPLPIYLQTWAQIRTHRRNNRLHDWYNFCLRDLQPATVSRYLNAIFRFQQTSFKVSPQ